MGFFTWLGIIGSVLACISYLLLTLGYIRAQRGYAFLTLVCAGLIISSLIEQPHYGTAIINVFFIGVACWGLFNPVPVNMEIDV